MPRSGVPKCWGGREGPRLFGAPTKPKLGEMFDSSRSGALPALTCLLASAACSGTLLVLQADAAVRLSGGRWRVRTHERKKSGRLYMPSPRQPPRPACVRGPPALLQCMCLCLCRLYVCAQARALCHGASRTSRWRCSPCGMRCCVLAQRS